MRRALAILGLVALAALLVIGGAATLQGAALAAGEVRRAPAVVAAMALMVVLRGPRALPAAAGWAVLGAAASVAWRVALGIAGENGWIPGEATSRLEDGVEAAWLVAVAVLAWIGMPGRLAGALVAVVVATTRIGAYGQALVPVAFEETLHEAALIAISLGAGFAAGVIVVVMGGWMASVLARVPERWVAPRRVLAGMAVVAAVVRA